jgi:hypothetical protein
MSFAFGLAESHIISDPLNIFGRQYFTLTQNYLLDHDFDFAVLRNSPPQMRAFNAAPEMNPVRFYRSRNCDQVNSSHIFHRLASNSQLQAIILPKRT